MLRWIVAWPSWLLSVGDVLADRLEDTFYVPLDDPAIQYAGPASDAVARLEKQLESGKVKLDYAPERPGLSARGAESNWASTSIRRCWCFRAPAFRPRTFRRARRARFISTTIRRSGLCRTAMCWSCPAIDPKQGAVFYSLDTEKSDKPGVRPPRRLSALSSGRADHGHSRTHGQLGASGHRPGSARVAWQRVHHRRPYRFRRTLGRLVRHRNARIASAFGEQPGTGRSAGSGAGVEGRHAKRHQPGRSIQYFPVSCADRATSSR